MSEKKAKKFRLFDAVLAVICVVFVAEAAAPVAAIGNSQFFWWIFLIVAFLRNWVPLMTMRAGSMTG